ncbi:MAG: ribonuclease [Betaproteobacteria bacterium]|nr:ribonuclease [Betaproteobacteria bacterium]MDE2048410.1 ribonuclease [Betaproteobacteria bacterium]
MAFSEGSLTKGLPRATWARRLHGAVLSAVAVVALSGAPAAQARTSLNDGLPTVMVSELPPQGQTTYRLIRAGGPFPYGKDGIVFGNRERVLPRKARGYYREYTVKTPGSRDRGARRIVCGGAPKTPDACYYTDDHYASFRRIVD